MWWEYQSGKQTYEQLAAKHGCSARTIQRRLDQYGIEMTVRPKRVRDGNMQIWCLDPNGYRVEFIQYMPGCPQVERYEEKKVFW